MDNIAKFRFSRIFNVERLITLFYMEVSKDFSHKVERHDYWEMVYIDKGEMLCNAKDSNLALKSGELTFHAPGEFHSHFSNGVIAPNVSIITFECKSREMKFFEGKIFKLDKEERSHLSLIFKEGLSHYKMLNEFDPLDTRMIELDDSPLGSSQMTKNLLENFLIKLRRNTESLNKKTRQRCNFDESASNFEVNEILNLIEANLYSRLSVSDIAVKLGKSESTVKGLFSEFKSGGIINYYNERKIAEARRLIREGKYNFTEIAEMLSFDTPQYFSKCFKKYSGLTPSEYKSSII